MTRETRRTLIQAVHRSRKYQATKFGVSGYDSRYGQSYYLDPVYNMHQSVRLTATPSSLRLSGGHLGKRSHSQ